MIKSREETIKYIIDSIIGKFGYDKMLYFPENRNDRYYKSEYMDFCNELSLETLNWNASSGKQTVLYNSGVSYQGENRNSKESFHLHLKFGYPDYHSYERLCDDARNHGKIGGTGRDIERDINDIEYITHDMLPGYHNLLRNRKIDCILG